MADADSAAQVPSAAPSTASGSGSAEAHDGGHDLRTFFGYRVCLKCYAHAKELKGKRRALGMLCAPAKLPSAQAERRRKAEKIMRGVDPKTGVTLK